MPASMPGAHRRPSAGDLVKISASGPMPTSRYWLHAPCAISAVLQLHRRGRAGLQLRQIIADQPLHLAAQLCRRRQIAARPLLDHPLQHRDGEGDAGRLERLQIDRSSAATAFARRASSGGVLAMISRAAGRPPRRRRRATRRRGPAPRTDRAWWEIAPRCRTTPSARIATTDGPPTSGRQMRPARAPAKPSCRQIFDAYHLFPSRSARFYIVDEARRRRQDRGIFRAGDHRRPSPRLPPPAPPPFLEQFVEDAMLQVKRQLTGTPASSRVKAS